MWNAESGVVSLGVLVIGIILVSLVFTQLEQWSGACIDPAPAVLAAGEVKCETDGGIASNWEKGTWHHWIGNDSGLSTAQISALNALPTWMVVFAAFIVMGLALPAQVRFNIRRR